MKKLGCAALVLLALLGLAAGLAYAAWETDYIDRPVAWVVQNLPFEEEDKLRVATKVIEYFAQPWDVVELKVLDGNRVFMIAVVPALDTLGKPQFMELWEVYSRVAHLLQPDVRTMSIALGEVQPSYYSVYMMYSCPGEKVDFEQGHDCQIFPVYASLPLYAVRFAGR